MTSPTQKPENQKSDNTGSLPRVRQAERRRLLGPVLRDVSRAFYLTLRVLPSGMREPVGLAYLLARAADTVADTTLLPHDRRLAALLAFRGLVEGPATSDGVAALLNEVPDGDELDAERVLLTSLPQALSMLESLDVRDRQLVRSVVVALTQGMEMDLTDLAPREPCEIRAVQDAAQLDAYVYGVAGCVGEFWTAISISRQSCPEAVGCLSHVPAGCALRQGPPDDQCAPRYPPGRAQRALLPASAINWRKSASCQWTFWTQGMPQRRVQCWCRTSAWPSITTSVPGSTCWHCLGGAFVSGWLWLGLC